MEAWEKWWRMGQGSLAAAQILAKQGEARSSASRAYYASYQSVTAVLLYYGMTPPDGREAWSHEATPELVWKLSGTIISQNARRDIAQRLEASYRLRLNADYISVAEVGEAVLKIALKDASFIARLVEDVLSQG